MIPKLKSDFFSRLPFYSIYVILNIDYHRIIATAIEKKKGINTLLCQDIFTSPNFETDYSNIPIHLANEPPSYLHKVVIDTNTQSIEEIKNSEL